MNGAPGESSALSTPHRTAAPSGIGPPLTRSTVFQVEVAKPATAADAEKMYNIAKWGNNAEVVSTYRLTQDTTMYVGDVAGGTGQQVLLPRGTSATSVFQQVGQEPLP